jgi:hypothetical protein
VFQRLKTKTPAGAKTPSTTMLASHWRKVRDIGHSACLDFCHTLPGV